jgi:hypothetical protein
MFVYSNWQLEKTIWWNKLHSIWKGMEDTASIVVTPPTTCCRLESTCCTEGERPAFHVSRHRQEDDGRMGLVEMKHKAKIRSNFEQDHIGRERHHTKVRSTDATSSTRDGRLKTGKSSRQEAEDSSAVFSCSLKYLILQVKLWLEDRCGMKWHNDIDAVHWYKCS